MLSSVSETSLEACIGNVLSMVLLIWVHAEDGFQNSTVTYLLGWHWGLPRHCLGLGNFHLSKASRCTFPVPGEGTSIHSYGSMTFPIFTSNNCSLQCYTFQPCRNQQQSLFLCPCNYLQCIFLSFFLHHFFNSLLHTFFVLLFSFCPNLNIMNCFHWKCFWPPLTNKWQVWRWPVGCTSLSSAVPWEATLASQWPQWSLLPETKERVCVLKKQVCWENAELLYLTGRRQGVDGRNGRVLSKFRGVFNFFPHYKFLIVFLPETAAFSCLKTKANLWKMGVKLAGKA